MTSHIGNIFNFVQRSGSFPSIRNQYQTNSQIVEHGEDGAVLNTAQPIHHFAQE